nr:hypothetical protein [Tanacetum cinerariifolium]
MPNAKHVNPLGGNDSEGVRFDKEVVDLIDADIEDGNIVNILNCIISVRSDKEVVDLIDADIEDGNIVITKEHVFDCVRSDKKVVDLIDADIEDGNIVNILNYIILTKVILFLYYHMYEHKRTCYCGNGGNDSHDSSSENGGNGTGCGKLNEHINALDMLDDERELKRQTRKQSNREYPRRSTLRKQEENASQRAEPSDIKSRDEQLLTERHAQLLAKMHLCKTKTHYILLSLLLLWPELFTG